MSLVGFLRSIAHSSARRLTQLAAITALVGLAVFAASLIYPKPLIVIFSMSAGHAIGALAFFLYLGAVVVDNLRPGSPFSVRFLKDRPGPAADEASLPSSEEPER